MQVNKNFAKLKDAYLFRIVDQKKREYIAKNPDKKIISLGIGDTTLPLCPAVIDALHGAANEMADIKTYKGYGLEQGTQKLRDAIVEYYAGKGVKISTDEVFVSEGAASDISNILDLFSAGQKVLIPNPTYPAYADTNIIEGNKIVYDLADNPDIIYHCSPNNPTGAVATKAELKELVDWANEHGAVIIFDSAYEAFIRDPKLPTSIFQIPNAKKCAIEIASFSKTAGFTGVRCGYTVVPHELVRGGANLNAMWLRRQTTRFNGTSYISQMGAAAAFSPAGIKQTREIIDYYMGNARLICDTLDELKIEYIGGKNAPYIWIKVPAKFAPTDTARGVTPPSASWAFFDWLLNTCAVVGTAGVGFGSRGEGYFRLTAFATRENTTEAMARLKDAFKKL